MSLHPIADKAGVSVDFPDKAYMGIFGRHSQFDACANADDVAIKLVRPGEDRREAVIHLHYGFLAEILAELARSLERIGTRLSFLRNDEIYAEGDAADCW